MTTASTSQVRQNYHQDSEAAINRQINLELYASSFDRDDVALKNFAKYFLHQSHEEREHAEKLMKLHNQGGGIERKNILAGRGGSRCNPSTLGGRGGQIMRSRRLRPS
uniref:Ferritin n=1 Tax=Nomascus leucogenys TaxID=61853 RepID=A0A2I3GTC4_NOMLE